MKYLSIALVLGLSLTLVACDKAQQAATEVLTETPATETSSPAPGAEPTAEVNEPELTGKYQAYSAAKVAMLKGEQKFGVFFHADWCPTCVKWEERTTAALESLPDSTLILKADYDAEQDLVKELHVKKQSTLVFFDSNGDIVDAVADPSVEQMSQFFTTPDFDVLGAAGERYAEFDQAQFDASLGSEKMVVFFHADWCGTCRKWEKNLQANLDTLNPQAKILKANFDDEADLRQVFGVTKQSQAVFLNADGSVAKNEGDPSIDSINEFFGA